MARIILTRPAVEAGERLGFLPGTLQEKVDPYLRPLYDALYDMLESDRVEKLLERNVIEVAPIAFMRGRTLNDSFIILDEAQNSTVRADEDGADAPGLQLQDGGERRHDADRSSHRAPQRPGGRHRSAASGVEGISFVQFDEKDVVRHTLVQRIVKAYERYNEAIGAGRQLSLKLAEPEPPQEPAAAETAPQA